MSFIANIAKIAGGSLCSSSIEENLLPKSTVDIGVGDKLRWDLQDPVFPDVQYRIILTCVLLIGRNEKKTDFLWKIDIDKIHEDIYVSEVFLLSSCDDSGYEDNFVMEMNGLLPRLLLSSKDTAPNYIGYFAASSNSNVQLRIQRERRVEAD